MIRKTLVRVKSLLQAQRLKEAENVIEGVINEGHSHSDLYYMAGEVKRSLGKQQALGLIHIILNNRPVR